MLSPYHTLPLLLVVGNNDSYDVDTISSQSSLQTDPRLFRIGRPNNSKVLTKNYLTYPQCCMEFTGLLNLWTALRDISDNGVAAELELVLLFYEKARRRCPKIVMRIGGTYFDKLILSDLEVVWRVLDGFKPCQVET